MILLGNYHTDRNGEEIFTPHYLFKNEEAFTRFMNLFNENSGYHLIYRKLNIFQIQNLYVLDSETIDDETMLYQVDSNNKTTLREEIILNSSFNNIDYRIMKMLSEGY